MKKLYFILVASLYSVLAVAQPDSFTLVRSYTGDIANAAIDNLDNLYIVSSKGSIRKFNSNGDSVAIYNQIRNYGALFSLDVTNPLKLLLFYKNFSTIVLLDRFLTQVAVLDLRRFSVLQPGAVGISYDNNIWVFDEWDNKLKKIDEQGKKLLETPDLRTVFNTAVSPQKIINDNGFVYLADTASGVFVFDNYGSYKRTIPVKGWQSIAISNNNVISTAAGALTIYNTTNLMQSARRLPAFAPYLHSFTGVNKIAAFSTDTLRVYRMAHPVPASPFPSGGGAQVE